jgi:hypothetical protein
MVTKRSKLMGSTLKSKVPSANPWEPTVDRSVTLEQIVDRVKMQIFSSGAVSIMVRDIEQGTESVETVQGIDAQDVELILQLFGVAQ